MRAAAGDAPDRLDPAVAHRDDLLVQMHGGVAIADDQLQLVADRGRSFGFGKIDRAVLRRQTHALGRHTERLGAAASLLIAFLPASMMTRVSVGRLVTVASRSAPAGKSR